MQAHLSTIRNRLDRILPIATAVVLFVSANFGLSLFFSINHNILDPQVHLWPVALKDGAWIGLFALVVLMRLVSGKVQPDWPWGGTAIWVAALLSLVVAGIALLLRDGSGLDVNYVRSLKNYFSYQLLPYLFVFLAPWRWPLRKILFWAMVSALVISCSVYGLEAGLKPGNAADARMYGSMGNPNAVGLVAAMVLAVLLSEWERALQPVRLIILVLVWGATMLSASFSAMAIIAIVLLWKAIEMLFSGGMKVSAIFVAQVLGTFVLVFFGLYLILGIRLPILMRMSSIFELLNLGSLGEMDSIAVRTDAWMEMGTVELGAEVDKPGMIPYRQYDSAIQTFLHNYGVPGAVMISLPILMIVWALANRARQAMVFAQNRQLEIFSCVLIVFFSGLLQYQMSHFPTNLLFNMAVALLVRDVVLAASRDPLHAGKPINTAHVWNGA